MSVGNVFVTESVWILTLDHWWYDVEYILPATFPSLWTEYNQVLNSADLRMRAICSWVHRFVLCRFESCSSFRFEDIWSYPFILALECHWPHCLYVGLSRYLSDSHFCSLILWSSTLCWACTDDYRFTAPFTYLSGTSSQTITLSFTMCYSFKRQLDLIFYFKNPRWTVCNFIRQHLAVFVL